MDAEDLSRRSLLQLIVAALGAAALPVGWPEIAQASQEAHAASQLPGEARLSFLSAAEAADVEAVAAQIIPTDDTPGARDAGVVCISSTGRSRRFSRGSPVTTGRSSPSFRRRFADVIQARHRSRALPSAAADRIPRRRWISTPFFDTTRLLTLLGMFSMPAYGGNRDGVGWKLIGFEDPHAFQPPFGYYDRDYPGFVDRSPRRPVSARTYPRFRDGRLRRRRLRRRRRRHRARTVAGRALRRVSRAGAAALRRADFEHDELKYWFLGGITNDAGQESADLPQRSGRAKAELADVRPALWYARTVGGSSLHYTANLLALPRDRLQRAQRARRRSPAPASPTGRSATPISSRTTPRSSGKSACRASPARVRSIRRAPSPIRCRRCR